jgi:hypothetical protein
MDVRINEQEMGRLRALLVKARHGQVAGPVDERLVLGRIEHHLDAVCGARTLQTKHRLGVSLETHPTVAWGTDEQYVHLITKALIP